MRVAVPDAIRHDLHDERLAVALRTLQHRAPLGLVARALHVMRHIREDDVAVTLDRQQAAHEVEERAGVALGGDGLDGRPGVEIAQARLGEYGSGRQFRPEARSVSPLRAEHCRLGECLPGIGRRLVVA